MRVAYLDTLTWPGRIIPSSLRAPLPISGTFNPTLTHSTTFTSKNVGRYPPWHIVQIFEPLLKRLVLHQDAFVQFIISGVLCIVNFFDYDCTGSTISSHLQMSLSSLAPPMF